MAFLKNRWKVAALFIICWALIASLLAGYYWLQYNDIQSRIGGILIYVNVGVDYGNKTRVFYNNTKALTGETLFGVTKRVVDVGYQASSFGIYVTSINSKNASGPSGWTYWIWNNTARPPWSAVMEGADAYKVTNEETFLWYYEAWDPVYGFTPPP